MECLLQLTLHETKQHAIVYIKKKRKNMFVILHMHYLTLEVFTRNE